MYGESSKRIAFQFINLEDINPFDEGHRPDGNGFKVENDIALTEQHKIGIEKVKGIIRVKRYVRPIIVRPIPRPVESKTYKYERMDGFCRYQAFKEMGFKVIPCYVDMFAEYGCQDGEGIVV